MSQRTFQITDIDPMVLYGVDNYKLNLIKEQFPKLKIVARGDTIKLVGDDEEIERFREKLDLLVAYFEQYNSLPSETIEEILQEGGEGLVNGTREGDDVLVYGNGGVKITAKTVNQRRMVDSVNKNDMVFAIGPAGTGKTYTAVALAVRALKNREVKRIVLTRPAVEAGENLGFLPGDLKEKLDPYLQPLSDALQEMIPAEKLRYYMENGVIQIAPLAFMRGRTLDHAIAIMDEAQNATEGQLKMFLTRMGRSSKFMITGDVTQVDLPKKQPSGLIKAQKILSNIQGIDWIELDDRDVIRHELVNKIIDAFDIEEGRQEEGNKGEDSDSKGKET
ncbi:MAG: PhoH family protein [Flavobacteriales bacterium]